jgi:tetratricopeptide (TPR) repeat protein
MIKIISLLIAAPLVAGSPTVATEGISGDRLATEGVTVEADAFPDVLEQPSYDGFQLLLDQEAREAMNAGDFLRAWHFFWRLLLINSNDVHALREIGRIACAAGALEYGAKTLDRVSRMRGEAPDPEIHFLRGQALISLDRESEGHRALTRAERELALAPDSIQKGLWLGRIYSLRGEVDRAEAAYARVLPKVQGTEQHADVLLLEAEGHIFASDWKGSEKRLRSFLARYPEHRRARAMLAWVLENRGRVNEELAMRAELAETSEGDAGEAFVEYGRALERAFQYERALDSYRKAEELGVESIAPHINRLERRLAPEAAAGVVTREDPSGELLGMFAGLTVPLSSRFRVTGIARHDEVTGDELTGAMEAAATTVSAFATYRHGRGNEGALGLVGWRSDARRGELGATGAWRSNPQRWWQVFARGGVNAPWHESGITVREGGSVDDVEAQVFAAPFSRRFVLTASGRVSRFGLAPAPGGEESHVRQIFGAAGIDVVLKSDFSREARGQILDDQLLFPTQLASSVVVSYRHYEQETAGSFGPRLVLVERSRLEEISGTARFVLDDDGQVAIAALAGIGYDTLRELWQWRSGGQFFLSATDRSRLALGYEVATESVSGITGRRQQGTLSLHVDF